MLGLWKLGAMSAVIGAGVVVVWQAQQGLQPQSEPELPSAPATAEVTPTPTPTDPTPFLADAIPPLAADSAAADQPVAIASVPPEANPVPSDQPRDFAPSPANDEDIPQRYTRDSRGLDFRRIPEMESQAAAESTNLSTVGESTDAPRLLPVETARPSAADEPAGSVASVPLKPVPEEDNWDALAPPAEKLPSDIQQVHAEAPAAEADDPFATAAPPELGPVPAPRTPPAAAPVEEAFDPFGGEPEPAAERQPPAVEDSAPQLQSPGPRATRPPEPPRDRPPLPTDLDEFEPFPADRAAASPKSLPEPIPAESEAPTPGDEPAPLAEQPAGNDRETPTPFPDRLESRSQMPDPPADRPADDESRPHRSEPPKPLADSLIGDGELPASAPRGVQEARLSIEKVAPPRAVIGQPLVYSVLVKNTGNSPANQVLVEDRIPKGTRLVGTAPRAELIDKRLTWKLGTIPAGEERKIAIKVIPEEEGSLGSVAKVTFLSEVAAEIVVTAPKLTLSVSGPDEVKIGSTAELVFTLSNPGNGDATNVVIRSVIPDGFQHPAGNDLEYALGTLAPKESREVRLELMAVKPGRLVHKAVVTADGNIGTESQTPVEVIGEQLLLTRSGHNRVYLGRRAAYTNSVTNEGPRPIDRVQIVETVPAGFEFVQATAGGRYEPGQRTITWTVGPLAPGAKIDVSTTLEAKSQGEFSSEIVAQGQTGSTARVQPTISIEGFPALVVEPLGEQRLVAIGEQVTSRIQLRNKGTATAKKVGLTITLPPELRLVSAKGPGKHRQEASRVIFDPLDEVLPSGTAEFQLVFEAQAAGDSRLEMQLSADHLRRPVRHEEAVQIVGN